METTLKLGQETRELTYEELCTTRGGIIPAIIAGLVIAAGAEIIRDWDNFKNGLMGIPEEK